MTAVDVTIRRSTRAKRLLLRVDALGTVELVLPPGVSKRQGEAFMRARWDWVEKQLAGVAPKVPFVDGAVVPILGADRALVSAAAERGRPRLEASRLVVPGPPSELANRTKRWMRSAARSHLARHAEAMAGSVGRRILGLSVRDTRSRWGSCSSRGTLSFSWRLILAPESVMRYVVAHEVAHLVELNHSERFWRIVESIAPDYRTHRGWLRENGAALHRYG